MIARFKRWWNRWFGVNYDLVDVSDIHEHLVNSMQQWEEDFHPDKWD